MLTHKYTKLKAIHNKSSSCVILLLVGANAQIYKIESNSQQQISYEKQAQVGANAQIYKIESNSQLKMVFNSFGFSWC